MAPDRTGQRPDDIFGKAEDLADFARCRTSTIGDYRCGQGRMFAAIALIDILDNLLAAFMFEINVDIGRLAALGRNKTLEQEIGQ